MNCRRIEESIPLYVEGDLDAERAGAVLSHTLSCANCNKLVAEYEESQKWLRSYAPPRFDDAALNDLKLSVLREINGRKRKVALLNSLAERWTRRLALATSAASLVIFAALAFYVYQHRTEEAPGRDAVAGEDQATQEKQPPEIPPRSEVTKQALRANFILKHRRHLATAPRREMVARSLKNREPFAERTGIKGVRQAIAGETRGTLSSEPAASEEMLRIEIQTSDPSIRIIWFSPKEESAHQTKPNTETE